MPCTLGQRTGICNIRPLAAVDRIKRKLFGVNSKFQVGSHVQEIDGNGPGMTVIEIATEIGLQKPLVHCRWVDARIKATRYKLFQECQLRMLEANASRLQ